MTIKKNRIKTVYRYPVLNSSNKILKTLKIFSGSRAGEKIPGAGSETLQPHQPRIQS